MRRRVALLVALLGAALVVVLLTVPFPVLPGAHPSTDVARDFTAAQIAREEAFHRALRPSAYLSLAVSLVVAGVLGLTRLGSRLVARIPGPWPVRSAGAVVALLAIGQVATLPLDVRSEQALRRYGLSTQDWSGWTDDRLRSLAVAAIGTSLAVLVVLGLARRFPRTWWVTAAAASSLLVIVGSFVYPVVVEPAFNHFAPLPASPLRTDLLALATRDGTPVEDVLVADASRRTTALNAYVSGFGSTRRIVLYDTLLREATPREVELVVAHELGHASEQDVLHGTVIGALTAAAGIVGLSILLSWSAALRRVGASGPGDPRVLPFVLFLAAATPLLVSPVTNLLSRHVEARADLHSLVLTGDVGTFVRSEQRLSVTNLSDLRPGPLVYGLFYTHPSGPQRIAFAREWERLHP